MRFLRRKERKFELSVISLSWMWKYSCQVCVLQRHFLCLPLSFNTGLLGDAGTFCDPVPEAAFCRVSINREKPVGYCALSVTYPGKPLPTLLPRQRPTHIIRITLDRMHFSEKCADAFTVQMGLLAFLGEKKKINRYMRVCLWLYSGAWEMRPAVVLGCWPTFTQRNTQRHHCLQRVEQIEDVLSRFTKGVRERCKSTAPPTNKAHGEGKKVYDERTKGMWGTTDRRNKHSPNWLIIGV